MWFEHCKVFLFDVHIQNSFFCRDREQREREKALADFRCGRCPVLVATSVAARGLDIPDVQQVINFDLPNNIDDYVHRIGRTGRCGNIGRAVSFFDQDNDSALAQSLISILAEVRSPVKRSMDSFRAFYFTLCFSFVVCQNCCEQRTLTNDLQAHMLFIPLNLRHTRKCLHGWRNLLTAVLALAISPFREETLLPQTQGW